MKTKKEFEKNAINIYIHILFFSIIFILILGSVSWFFHMFTNNMDNNCLETNYEGNFTYEGKVYDCEEQKLIMEVIDAFTKGNMNWKILQGVLIFGVFIPLGLLIYYRIKNKVSQIIMEVKSER